MALRGISAVLCMALYAVPLHAQSLTQALREAYEFSPQLNMARAALRATDENVPQALSGKRPRISANADAGYESRTVDSPSGNFTTTGTPGGFGITADQTLFDGFRTENRTRQAEAQVLVQREILRTTEQDVLLLAVTAYMDVVRDMALLDLRRNFVNVLGEQLRQTQARFNVGEITRTNVAQAEARQSLARAQMEAARAQLNASRANYRRFIGSDPKHLHTHTSVERMLPKSLDEALLVGADEHPQVRAATYGVDSAAFAIKIAEGTLLPTVSLNASLDRRFSPTTSFGGGIPTPGETRIDSAAITGRVTIPIYQGGLPESQIRQGKEVMGQRRLEVDFVRDQVRALVTVNWGILDAARAQIEATSAQSRASQIALTGVREEARVGQRTLLDALNAEQELFEAQATGLVAQRDRVVAAFALLGAIGRLNAGRLGLNIDHHDPVLHYEQVRDKWFGLRTPSGE